MKMVSATRLLTFKSSRTVAAASVFMRGANDTKHTYCKHAGFVLAMKRFASTTSSSTTDELHTLFNRQITKELSASQLYLSASIWCEGRDFAGMASFLRGESDEERSHALSLIDFANRRGLPVRLEALPAPIGEWRSLPALWGAMLDAERANTKALYALADAAQDARDHAVTALLQPLHAEQVEAEGHLKTILAKVHGTAMTEGLVFQLDAELGRQSAAAGGGD